ncbi:MAG TPA: LptF/LptG family permease [Verrucomicrobiae bacterium]|nr:LptF/LptG family permease [Verrucomicrobiae bacterium]
MKTLHKYLIRQVVASLLLTVAVFTFVLLLGDALKEILPLLISGHVRFLTVVEIFGCLIPFILVFALPLGLLTATLLAMGRFSADQELTAARAGGISLLSLVSPILLLSLLCCGLSAWINMDLGPRSRVECKNLILQLGENANSIEALLPEGQPVHISSDYIVDAEKNRDGNLENVTAYWISHNTTIQAPRGKIVVTKTNLVVTLFDLKSVTIQSNGTPLVSSLAEWPFIIDRTPVTDQIYTPKISDMTFWQLRDEMRRLERQMSLPPPAATNSVERLAEFREAALQRDDLIEPLRVQMHWQAAFSFACFGFALVGIPLGIRVHRRETNISFAMALVLAGVYFSFMLVGKSLAAHPEWSPHLIFWLPNFIFQAVGAVLLWRANKGV